MHGPSMHNGIDALADPVVVLDYPSLTVCHANPAAERLFGWSLDQKIGTSAVELLHHDDLPIALTSLETVVTKDAGAPIELRLKTATGWTLVELTGAHHTAATGQLLFLSLRDLTQRRRWEIAHDNTAAFRAIVHHSGALLIHTDTTGRITSCSAAATRDLGHDPELLLGQPVIELVHVEDRPQIERAFIDLQGEEPPGRVTTEARLEAHASRAVPYQLQIARLDADPTIDGHIISGHDITQLDQARRQLTHTASHDHLTGILNRAGFIQRLQADLETTPTTISVAFVDLNTFKAVNDAHGDATGDHVLTVIANRIRSAIRHSDYAGRIGGDEFAIALHAHNPDILTAITRRLTNSIAEPITTCTTTLNISAAIGHTAANPGDTVDKLLAQADAHMYQIKSSPTN